jgi:hypothetical protein
MTSNVRAVLEDWSTAPAGDPLDYSVMFDSGSCKKHLGRSLERALVVGVLYPRPQDGERRSDYRFLFVIRPDWKDLFSFDTRFDTQWLDVLRRTEPGLPRLRRAEWVLGEQNVSIVEGSMLDSFNSDPYVHLVEEIFFSAESGLETRRQVHFKRVLEERMSSTEMSGGRRC